MKPFFNKIILSSTLVFVSYFTTAAEISQAQIEQFKKMSPSQQQALASSMGVDLSSINALGNKSANNVQQSSPSLNELVPVRNNEPNIVEQTQETEKQTVEVDSLQFSSSTDSFKLKPFGYDLFAGEPSTFAPVSDVPIPAEYKVGPGDSLSIQLYGKETVSYNLTVNRQGNIDIPKLGPINVAGQNFSEVKNLISSIIQERKIGVKSNISMGELRSIRVFVLGEAYRAASYTLSSLATVTQAIYAAGGINDIGSLRNIQVKRRGKVVASHG